jgi:hypothetical protein
VPSLLRREVGGRAPLLRLTKEGGDARSDRGWRGREVVGGASLSWLAKEGGGDVNACRGQRQRGEIAEQQEAGRVGPTRH